MFTPLADRHAILDLLVSDLEDTASDQAKPHCLELDARPSRNLSDRKTASVKWDNLVHGHYLKRKQQSSLVAS